MKKYVATLFLLICSISCGGPITQSHIYFEPTPAEQALATKLNACERGSYYRLLQMRKELIYDMENSINREYIKEYMQALTVTNEEIAKVLDRSVGRASCNK